MPSIYYVEEEEQRGPVTLVELVALKGKGSVEDDTLVWKDGMEDWTPLAEALPLWNSPAEKKEAIAVAGVSLEKSSQDAGESNPFLEAAKSGAKFSPQDTARPEVASGDQDALETVKPEPIQPASALEAKLTERLAQPAGLGGRTMAYLIDSVIISIGVIAVIVLTIMLFGEGGLGAAVALLLAGVFVVVYDANLFGAQPCRTLGKRLMGMKVEKLDGSALSSGGAIVRTLTKLAVLGFTSPLVCFIVASCNSQKRSVQDFAASTMVVTEMS